MLWTHKPCFLPPPTPSRPRPRANLDPHPRPHPSPRGGSTKKKIARVCGAELDLNESGDSHVIEIYGTDEQRGWAKDYIR